MLRLSKRKAGAGEERFGFGKNWQQFLRLLDEDRIQEAEKSLCDMLHIPDMSGRSFIDVGCGSGLFSLAAMRLGASRVHSLDYDVHSVACAHELKSRFYPDATRWTIERGDALDKKYLNGLGTYDVVYSWGVLHHTGNMWQGIENVLMLVADRGKLFIAIYNDGGTKSRRWHKLKYLYNRGLLYRIAITGIFIPLNVTRNLISDLSRLKSPFKRYREYKKKRGMSVLRDWIDWFGGYPYEFAKPEEVAAFCRDRGFETIVSVNKSPGSALGNIEYILVKSPAVEQIANNENHHSEERILRQA